MFNNEHFNNLCQFFITYLLMPLLCVFIFIMSLIVFATTSHADEPSYFPMGQNDNNKITDNYINIINNRIGNNDDKYVLIKYAGKNGSNTLVDVAYWNKSDGVYVYGEVKNNGYQWSLYKVGSKSVNYRQFVFSSNGTVGGIYQESISIFQNINSSLYSTGISYVSNFQLYSTNAEDRNIILAYSDGPVVNIGAAVLPGPFFVPDYITGDSAPTNVPPSFTVNNYTWTTPPTFDNSSVINGIQSIKDTLEWLADNFHAEIVNLIDNIKGLVEYIGKTIQYYGNAIIDTINNAIQNFYDNMAALVQPILEKIAYLTEDFDSSSVTAAFTSTNFYGIKQQFTNSFTTFENAFDISEPNSFTLTINIQNIDTFYNFGCRDPVIIYLDSHFTPIKTALRTFLWIVISFSTVFVVEKGLSNWLRGERKE